MSSITKNKKPFIKNNNNNFKKIPFEQFFNKEKSNNNNKNKQKNLLLNSVNSHSKDKIISKKLNNSIYNMKNISSFNKTEILNINFNINDSININNKFYKNNNTKFKFYKNNTINKNSSSFIKNFREKNSDMFYPRMKSIYNNKIKNKDLNLSQSLNMNSFSPFINKKGDASKDKIKYKKIDNSIDSFRSKTPIISKIDNNSKSIKRNSKPRRNKSNINIYKNNLLHSGPNLNLNNIIKKKNSENKSIRNVIFQSNNIFSQFKPKKKNQNKIDKEALQLKKSLLNPILSKEISNDEKTNKNENDMNYFVEIKPKILQQENEYKSGGEILPLTSNSTNINILLNNNSTNNNLKNSNSDIINSAVIKQQFNINSNNNINNNDSNTQLNIYSARSLNNPKNIIKENSNILLNNDTFNIIKIQQNKDTNDSTPNPPAFMGKKIKCIHDISKTGLSAEEKKVNQDRDFIFHNFVSGFENIYFGVCDGHGYYGHEVSEFIKENLPMDLNHIIKSKKLDLNKDDLSSVLIETFLMENKFLLNNKQIDADLSGSTCVSVIYTPQKLIIANLGDSRCVLGSKINEEWKYENLSRDHTPMIKEEADRIKKCGGQIRPMLDEDGCFAGPDRVYMKGKDLPGLAMTRSFGDRFASMAGTISEPEIKEHILKPEDKFLILASDGLFQYITSEEVGNFVKGYYEKNDIVGCCEFLYKESYRKWILEDEDTVDDITIILVFFED